MDILDLMKNFRRKIQIRKPLSEASEDEALWQEVRRYGKMIPGEADPNLGRVREIKEEIKKGSYITSEVLEETAARLTIRFMKTE